MLERLFARRKSRQPGEARAPSTRRLTQEVAIDDLMQLFDSVVDPDYVLERLGYPRAALRRLESDDEISGALETRHDALVTTPWRLEPEEGQVAGWVREEIEPHLEQVLSGAWHALPYGYSVMEVIYRPDEGGGERIGGLETIIEKPFEWFTPKRDGRLYYMKPGTGIEGQRVDTAYKFLLTRHRASYRNPYGEALLSRLYWPWFFRTQGWQFWMTFLERHGQPLLLGKGSNPEKLADALARAVQDAVIAVGRDDEVTPVASGNRGESFQRVEEALVRRIQKRILGQTLTSGTDGGSGNRALGEVHERVRHDKRDADIRLVQPTVQRLIDAMVFLRCGSSAEAPRFLLEDGKGLQCERAERDVQLHQVGVRFTPEYFSRTYGLAEDEFEVEEGEPAAGGLGFSASIRGDGAGKPLPALVRQFDRTPRERFTPEQEQIEELVDSTLPQVPSPIDPQELRRVILASRDPEDLTERLAQMFDARRLGGRGEFRELLERALFTADIVGYGQASGADEAD